MGDNAQRGKQQSARQACADGAHELYSPPGKRGKHRVCGLCGVSAQTLYSQPRGAAEGDFRVVCTEDDCQYGERTDEEGNGYSNHALLILAKAALRAHQREAVEAEGESHSAKIQQHPVSEVTGDGG